MLKMTAFWIVTCFKNAVKWNYLKSLLFYQVESSRFITYIMYSCNNVALILTFISTLCNKFLHWVLFTAAINVLYTIHVSSLFFTQSWRVRVKKKQHWLDLWWVWSFVIFRIFLVVSKQTPLHSLQCHPLY